MSDDMLIHFSSNSSNQSDNSLPTKIAKLEAPMVGKASLAAPSPVTTAPPLVQQQQLLPTWSSVPAAVKFIADDLAEPSASDSDDYNGEFLIQANTQKRQKLQEVEVSPCLPIQIGKEMAAVEGILFQVESRSQIGSAVVTSSNGQLENSYHMQDSRSNSKEHLNNENRVSLEEEVTILWAKVAILEEDLRKSCQEASNYQNQCRQLEKELKDLKDKEHQVGPKITKVISDLLISISKAERQETRMKVKQDSLRLGNVGVLRAGTVISETWEDGQALKDVNAQLRQLIETKEVSKRQRKSLKKRQSDKGDGADSETGIQEDDLLIQEEIYKSHLANLKRVVNCLYLLFWSSLCSSVLPRFGMHTCIYFWISVGGRLFLRERDRYELEKLRLMGEMKRIRDEDASRFNNFQILNHRYALLNLLGKGDSARLTRYFACKIHGLNAQWSEEKKQSYIRHATSDIHMTLVHHHIVRLWDMFTIDHNTFCTVLEYCSGKDLEAVLKATPVLPEKEARIIIVQIFQGLIYLKKRTHKIIHYDLKLGNVLFDELGVAKVTDFGLSKIVENDVGSQGMELTSQGAGTYWYLPPECFELSKTPLSYHQSCLSEQVDVWSAGILFYQMLFGKRPFGHDQTQERILREDTIIKARKVEFPAKPSVSIEAKDLIRRCLTYNQEERPDVLNLAQDPYLSYAKK
ncbi:hypothetical protein UlMin_016246 [Ulmus minor]